PDHGIVAVAAENEVVALAAEDSVISLAAIESETDRTGGERRGFDLAVAEAAVGGQLVGGVLMGDDDAGGGTADADAAIERPAVRSEERRGGKECRAGSRHHDERENADATPRRACEVEQHPAGRKGGPA